MSWFAPKLEPGERMILRHPPVWLFVVLAVVVVTIAAAPTVTDLLNRRIESWTEGTIGPDAVIGAVMLLPVWFFVGRWHIAVTDRRVLLRQGFFGWRIEAMDRRDIEAVYFSNGALVVAGQGRELSTFCIALYTGPLLKQIDPLYDNLKLRTPALRRILLPGERVLLRLRRPAAAILAWTVAPALPLLIVILLLAFPDALDMLFGLFSGLMTIVALLLFIILLELAFSISWAGLFFDHWRIAVTDWRVLVRRGLLGAGREEITRADIETRIYDRAGSKLVLAGAGRELVIACSLAQAGRIMKATAPGEENA
jgi:hypothetical protein